MQSFVLKKNLNFGAALVTNITKVTYVPKILKGCEVKTTLLAIKSQNFPGNFLCGVVYFLPRLFVFQLDNVGDVIEKIRIGHDNKGMTPGWHLDKVEVRRLKEDGETSTTYTFPCKRWLAKDEDDGSVVRELIPQRVVEESVTEDGQFETKEINHETLER